ncbi:MAG: YegS/Rv2252/BmrU family lipid kinase [Clostridia bacterium]|nr:YegS/Rv2252/BmrU family lipid kinase [Clostridia bacterium]
MKKKLLLIINPRSGINKINDDLMDATAVFGAHGYEMTIMHTTRTGDATDYAREHGNNFDIVVCRGGDGTFCEMMNGIMQLEKKPDIGYMPAGTTNEIANNLGLPVRSSAKAAQLIVKETALPYDLATFNGQYFTYVASFGALTECSYATPQNLKNKIGRFAYFYEAAKEIKDIHNIPIRCVVDGVEIEDNFIFGAISNSYTVGKVIHLNRDDVCLNDGMFEIILAKNPGTVKGWASLAGAVLKKNLNNPGIVYLKGKHIELETTDGSPLPWTLDGEYGGNDSKVVIDVHKHCFNFFRPPLVNEMTAAEETVNK